jgi:hypothetical protein
MIKIKLDNLELIINNNQLSVIRRRLVHIAPKQWIVETFTDIICKDITSLKEEI